MKGNIIKELRGVVKTLYSEGHEEIFAISIVGSGDGMKVQVVDFFMNSKTLSREMFSKTYIQADRALKVVKARCGSRVVSVSAMVCDEETETMFVDGRVLRIFNLNCLYTEGGDSSYKNTVGESVRSY